MLTKMTLLSAGAILVLAGSAWRVSHAGPLSSVQAAAQPARQKTLAEVVVNRRFPEYAEWWDIGDRFAALMSEAIVAEWRDLRGNDGRYDAVSAYASEYLKTVYGRDARPSLLDDFVGRTLSPALRSGEFDALSYAFFRSAFELIARHAERYEQPLAAERRLFTRRVGRRFFDRLQRDLALDLPKALADEASFGRLKEAIRRVGAFLKEQGYFRDHVAFRFDVDAVRKGTRIVQAEGAVLDRLTRQEPVYALFEMGYPVILPSAVYLFETIGEAQHHSSRTIEELFDRVGCEARETPDFDPRGYPSDMVVELWELRLR